MIGRLGALTISCGTIVVVGIGLRLWQYLYNRSLWADEAAIALNLLEKSFIGLLKPLDSLQSAPPLFLWIEKAMLIIIGSSDLAFRFFPFISSLLAIIFFYVFLKQIRASKESLMISLVLFAGLPTLIYYSSELKQYSSDVAIFLAMLILSGSTLLKGRIRTFLLALGGSVAIFISHAAVIFLPAIWVSEWMRKEDKSKPHLLFIGVIWTAFALLFYFLFVRDHPTRPYMLEYWEPHFMPLNPFRVEFWNWFGFKAYKVFGSALEFNAHVRTLGIPYLLFFLGIFRLVQQQKYPELILLLLPIIVHLGFSAFHFYPFFTRFYLYLLPLFIILVTEGISFVIDRSARYGKIVFFIISSLVTVNLAWACLERIPKPWMEAKACLESMAQDYQDSDYVVVSMAAYLPLRYYRKIGVTKIKETKFLELAGENFSYQDIPELSNRVWLLSGRWGLQLEKEREEQMIRYLSKEGKLVHQKQEYNCSAYLFEFP